MTHPSHLSMTHLTPPYPCMTHPTPPLHDPPHTTPTCPSHPHTTPPSMTHPTPAWPTPPLHDPHHPYMTHPFPAWPTHLSMIHPTPAWPTPPLSGGPFGRHAALRLFHFIWHCNTVMEFLNWNLSSCLLFHSTSNLFINWIKIKCQGFSINFISQIVLTEQLWTTFKHACRTGCSVVLRLYVNVPYWAKQSSFFFLNECASLARWHRHICTLLFGLTHVCFYMYNAQLCNLFL